MDFQTRKLHLIEWLAKTQDELLLTRIEELVNETPKEHYYRMLGNGEEDALRNMVREGTEDWKAGKVHTTEELRARYKKCRNTSRAAAFVLITPKRLKLTTSGGTNRQTSSFRQGC